MERAIVIDYITDLLTNLAKASPMTIYQSGALASLISLDPKFVVFSLLTLVFGDGFNFIAKKYSKQLCADNPVCNRPLIYEGDGSIAQCRTFQQYPVSNNLDKLRTQSFGMPSGHSQMVALTATFWTLYQVGHLKQETDSDKRTLLILSMVVMWLLALGVMYQRKQSHCHNLEQIVIGGFLGVLFGFLAYLVATNIPGVNIPDINNILFDESVENNDEDDAVEDNEESEQTTDNSDTVTVEDKKLVLDLQNYESKRHAQDVQNIHSKNLSLESRNIII